MTRMLCDCCADRHGQGAAELPGSTVVTLHCAGSMVVTLHCAGSMVVTLHCACSMVMVTLHCAGSMVMVTLHCAGNTVMVTLHCADDVVAVPWVRVLSRLCDSMVRVPRTRQCVCRIVLAIRRHAGPQCAHAALGQHMHAAQARKGVQGRARACKGAQGRPKAHKGTQQLHRPAAA